MSRIKYEYVTSIIGVIIFAHFYAVFEHWFSWESRDPLLSILFRLPKWHGVSAYQYIFMFILFAFIGGLPLWDDIFFRRELNLATISLITANALLAGLIEDYAYFYLYGMQITPQNWTAQIIGYIRIDGTVIPLWYLLLTPIITILYYYAFTNID